MLGAAINGTAIVGWPSIPRHRYASWLNQVERWFGHVTQQAIRRGSFRTVRALVRRIDAFVRHYNAHSCPFAWTATADSILAKLERLLKAITGTAH